MTPRPTPEDDSNAAGSPPSGEPAFLAVGKLRRAHGVKGEMIMDLTTDFPERLLTGSRVFVGDEHLPLRLRSRRVHQNSLLVSFKGYDSPEALAELRNQVVYVLVEDRPALPEGEYYHHELIGLRVETDAGETLGSVAEILETGSNDVIVVAPESGPEILLPFIDEVILAVNISEGWIRVHLLSGLRGEVENE